MGHCYFYFWLSYLWESDRARHGHKWKLDHPDRPPHRQPLLWLDLDGWVFGVR